MTQYYKVDYRRFTLRECWNCTRSAAALALWIGKLLRRPMRTAYGIPMPPELAPVASFADDLPPAQRESLAVFEAELASKGFEPPQFYELWVLMPAIFRVAAMLHQSGEAFAALYCVEDRTTHPATLRHFVNCVTAWRDGTVLLTTSQREELKGCPDNQIVRLVGASPAALWEAHQQALELGRLQRIAQPLASAEDVRQTLCRIEAAEHEYLVSRGVLTPMNDEEVEEALSEKESRNARRLDGVGGPPSAQEEMTPQPITAAISVSGVSPDGEEVVDAEAVPPTSPPAEAAVRHPEVLAELRRLEQTKSTSGQGWILLLVSVGLFFAAGAAWWSWKFVLLLIPIVLFHELGHYVAMRVFRYRNLRMFFIPLFGAAVAGRHYNVPGWKKAVVSLMGPVPGILLGTALAAASLFVAQEWLWQTALIAVALNALNLLPLLPLDGGWVMQAVVFSRHFLLDGGFRLAAAVVLLGAGALLGDWLLLIIGVPMALSLPAAFRMAKIAARLRRQGISAASPDAQTVPHETADAVIDQIKSSTSTPLPNKLIAQQTLSIFEMLNARPPGWIASAMLLATYAGSFLLAFVALGILAFVRMGAGGETLDVAGLPFECDAIERWQGDAAKVEGDYGRPTIIAAFEDERTAQSVLTEYKQRLPARASATRIGSTLLVAMPADEPAELNQFVFDARWRGGEAAASQFGLWTSMQVTCAAPSAAAAERIERRASAYFRLSSWQLIPPWTPDDQRAAQLRTQHLGARRTVAELEKKWQEASAHPRVAEAQKKWMEAQEDGDQNRIEQLHKEMMDVTRQVMDEYRAKMRATGEVDEESLKLHEALVSDDQQAASDARRQLQARMGAVETLAGAAAPGALSYSTLRGAIERDGAQLRFSDLSFYETVNGAPALLRWLCAQQCQEIEYGFEVGNLFPLPP